MRVLLAFAILTPLLLGSPSPIKQNVPRLPCFKPDSGRIAYGTIGTASDGDRSGVQFSFETQGGRLLGWVRDARGGLPPEHPLDSLAVSSRGDSLYFSYLSDSETRYSYVARVTCGRLRGKARLFQTASYAGQVIAVTLPRATWISKP